MFPCRIDKVLKNIAHRGIIPLQSNGTPHAFCSCYQNRPNAASISRNIQKKKFHDNALSGHHASHTFYHRRPPNRKSHDDRPPYTSSTLVSSFISSLPSSFSSSSVTNPS